MIRTRWWTAIALTFVATMMACAKNQWGAPTTTTSAPSPGSGAPASPATAWSTSGGPASAGSPAQGTVVDPEIEAKHDGGVW